MDGRGARISVLTLRPGYGREANSLVLLDIHLELLHSRGLITSRAPVIGRTSTNEIIAIFEWDSAGAIAAADSDPTVLRNMRALLAVADLVALTDVVSTSEPFFELAPLAAPTGAAGQLNSPWRAVHLSVPSQRPFQTRADEHR